MNTKPTKDSPQLHVLVPADLDARLRATAIREDRTISATVLRALRYYLDRPEGERGG